MNIRRIALLFALTISMAAVSVACGRGFVSKTSEDPYEADSQTSIDSSMEMTESLKETIESSTEAVTESMMSTEEENQEVSLTETTDSNEAESVSESVVDTSELESSEGNDVLSEPEEVSLDMDWEYADFSAIHDGTAIFYPAMGSDVKNITVCVNAGHGTRGGSSYSTYSHPDKTGKCTGGTNANGAVKSTAIAEGTTMDDGTPEAVVTLKLAKIVKEDLLEAGYNVLMIRESEDVQLDNIARTVIANNMADCHIALHYDSGSNNKGAFYISVPENQAYRSMEPVASMWREHNRLGQSLVDGMENQGVKIWSSGNLEIDLTQTSFSTIPSVDLEIGDQASDYSETTLRSVSKGIVEGLKEYWE